VGNWELSRFPGPILALDFGKYKGVACAYDPPAARHAGPSF
jgi:hypothetical protein